MNKLGLLLITGMFFILVKAQSGQTLDPLKTYGLNPLDSGIYLADPAIFYDNGVYYLYGTVGANADNGFTVYMSTDLKKWNLSDRTEDGYALRKGESFGNKNFWAPHVFKYQNKYYMAYVADENIAIAESLYPYGPFTQKSKQPLAAPVKLIDPFIYMDNGKVYLYHVRLSRGNRLYVAEMNKDLLSIKENTLRECIAAESAWENTAAVEWSVAEGPSILKHKNLYYFIYSANDFRNPDYAVGYATSSSPAGPWKKFRGNPILNKNDAGINGPGHGDFFNDKNGDLYYVFHTHYSDSKVSPRRTAIIKAMFKNINGEEQLVFDKSTLFFPELN